MTHKILDIYGGNQFKYKIAKFRCSYKDGVSKIPLHSDRCIQRSVDNTSVKLISIYFQVIQFAVNPVQIFSTPKA